MDSVRELIGLSFADELSSAAQRLEEEYACDEVPLAIEAITERLEYLTAPIFASLLKEILVTKDSFYEHCMVFATKTHKQEAIAALEKRLRTEGTAYLYREYPVLEAVLPQVVDGQVRSLLEAKHRLKEKSDEISARFFSEKPVGRLLQIKSHGGDPYNDEKSTMRLVTEGGVLFYKPRDTQVDEAYCALVQELFPQELACSAPVSGDGFAFFREITRTPVTSQEDIATYYRNLGVQTALATAIGLTDLHAQNIIASGVQPAAIDVETLLSLEPNDVAESNQMKVELELDRAQDESSMFSVMGVCLLPTRLENTIWSSLFYKGPSDHKPVFDGDEYTIEGYESEFVEGFVSGYRRCMASTEQIRLIMRGLDEAPVRLLLRSTEHYRKMIGQMISARGKSVHEAQDIVRELASFAFLSSEQIEEGGTHVQADHGDIPEAEIEILLRCNIPLFYALGNGCDLMSQGTVVKPNFFFSSALDGLDRRLAMLSEKKLVDEEELIHSVLKRGHWPATIEHPDTGDLLEGAEHCLKKIMTERLRRGGWIIIDRRKHLHLANLDYYDGLGGIAAFAAMLQGVTGKPAIREHCNDVISYYLEEMNKFIDFVKTRDDSFLSDKPYIHLAPRRVREFSLTLRTICAFIKGSRAQEQLEYWENVLPAIEEVATRRISRTEEFSLPDDYCTVKNSNPCILYGYAGVGLKLLTLLLDKKSCQPYIPAFNRGFAQDPDDSYLPQVLL